MTTPSSTVVPLSDDLDLLRADLRDGRSFVTTFNGPRGIAAVEVMGPKGMRQGGGFLSAPVRTLRLWVAGQPFEPEAVAAADQDLDAGLQAIVERARPHVDADELPALVKLLDMVRAAVEGRRPRVPAVAMCVTESGSPSFRGWASCLTLGDLEVAIRSALRPPDPAMNAQAA